MAQVTGSSGAIVLQVVGLIPAMGTPSSFHLFRSGPYMAETIDERKKQSDIDCLLFCKLLYFNTSQHTKSVLSSHSVKAISHM